MVNFLHTFTPQTVAITLGPLNIYWYGICIVIAIISAMLVSYFFWKRNGGNQDNFLDLSVHIIIGGLLGARIYDCLLNLPYYLSYPLEFFKVWHGGMAIHGAIIGGLLAIILYTRIKNINFLSTITIVILGLPLGQAIGRWGNYFNQELFGLPTNLPWGIPITQELRPENYLSNSYFHPTFLYESLLCFILFLVILFIKQKKENSKNNNLLIISTYLISYGIIRFLLELIRVDQTPELFGLRTPQVASLTFIITGFFIILKKLEAKIANLPNHQ